MTLLLGFMVLCAVAGALYWYFGPRVPEQRVAEQDLDLVREPDRAAWRRLRLQSYRSGKKHDDFYRVAAFRKLVADGTPEEEARVRVRRDYPFYYLDPADRDAPGFAGDDGALPALLRRRVEGSARVLKELAAEQEGRFTTMNALIRACIRKRAI